MRGLHADRAPQVEAVAAPTLRQARQRVAGVLRLAEPELQFLHESVQEHDGVVLLTDASGLILECRGGGAFATRASRLGLKAGVGWGEAERGTQAIGLSLVENHLVEVWGPEHFHQKHRTLSCTAAPFVDAQGQILGVLAIAGEARLARGWARALIKRAVREVEYRVLLQAPAHATLVHLHADRSCLGSYLGGVLWLDQQRVIGAGRPASRLLALALQQGVGLAAPAWAPALAPADTSAMYGEPVAHQAGDRPASVAMLLGRSWSSLFVSPLPQPMRTPHDALESVAVTLAGERLAAWVQAPVTSQTLLTAADGAAQPGASTGAPDSARQSGGSQRLTSKGGVVGSAVGSAAASAWFDPAVALQLQRASRAVDAGLAVMVLGETGSGKEVFARALHRASRRADGPFVAVNCAAFPETLIESELFGYQDGAFTGARKQGARGRIAEADGGLLFLDEIGDMPLVLQTRLLRVLQERTITPLGGGQERSVDFAVLCATHRDLGAMVQAGQFRADLFYRLQSVVVRLPSWRERLLSDRQACFDALWEATGGPQRRIQLHDEVRQRLIAHDWPGNLRQLAQTLTTLVVLSEAGDTVTAAMLPAELQQTAALPTQSLELLNREAILHALSVHQGRVAPAAKALGIHRATLYRRMQQLGLDRRE